MARTLKQRRSASSASSVAVTIAAWLALIVTVATLCLTLLGYGHDLAYLDAVGLRPEELQRSPLDFLLRSWRPLAHWIAVIDKFRGLEFHQAFWMHMWHKTWWWLLSSPVFTAFVAWCLTYKPWRWYRKLRWIYRRNCLIRTLIYLGSQRKKMVAMAHKWQAVPIRRWGYAGWLTWPFIVVTSVFLLLSFYLVVGMSILMVSFVPILGMSSGTATAEQEVLNPIGCVGQKLKPGDDVQRQARCVRIKREGREVARGYLVDYGAGRGFLYQPCTRQPSSFALDGASIEQIKSLEFASPGKDCRNDLVAP